MKPVLGITLKILSALSFTVMSAGAKIVSARYPIGEIIFFRSLFALVPLLAWLSWQGHLVDSVRTRDIRGHLIRGGIGCLAMFCSFAAVSYLPLHDAIAIGYASPLMVVALAAFILKERVRAYRWGAVAFGFAGVIVMLLPHLNSGTLAQGLSSGPALGASIALFGAFCSAGAAIQISRLTATEQTGAIVLYFSLLTTLFGLATAIFGWRWPDSWDLVLLVAIGILGGIGQILVTQAYRFAETSIVAPFEYTTMIWAVVIGWFLFGDLPTIAVALGALIVVAAGLFVIWRERRPAAKQ